MRARPVPISSTLSKRRMAVTSAAAGALLVAGALPASAGSAAAAPSFDRHRAYVETDLVSDQPGHAMVTDPNLVNPWGLSHGPTTPLWVSDNGKDVTTLYAGAVDGSAVAPVPLVVSIPAGAPTGQVFNDTSGFVLSNGAPALFVFASENGSIAAWNKTLVPVTSAETVGGRQGAVYKGLALLHKGSHAWLLASDFHHGRVDVWDDTFMPVHLPSWAFSDPSLPKGYAPFGIQVVGSRVYVSYAKQDATGHDDVGGPGHGFVDVYGAGGHLLKRLASRGVLDSPWGMAIAPHGFGPFAGDLLVGNFGDGRIHAFDPRTGHLDGTLRDTHGKPLVIDGLWGLLAGNGTAADSDDVWFSAGPDGETHGLLGIIRSAQDD